MSKKGPILLIDDDADECELIKDVLEKENIENKLICFSDGKEVIDYLKNTAEQPFLILSDINMPGMNGIELRKKLNEYEELRSKSIPFVFLTTTATPPAIKKAYEMSVQGFFEKEASFQEIAGLIRRIYEYWQICRHPNN